jgi:simple sugar transport system permease protein
MAFIRTHLSGRIFDAVPFILALLLALMVASVLLLALNVDPFAGFSSLWNGAAGTENAFAETLVKAIPIMFVAVGICIAFRGGVVNIGGEGQMIAGAVAGTAVTLAFGETAGALVIPLAVVAGFFAGALYGGLAGFLKAYFDVNEILSTIMLNQIAVQVMNYLLNGPLLDPAEAGLNNVPKTARILESTQLPRLAITLPGLMADLFGLENPELFARTRLHFGLILAILCAIIVYVLLWRTSIGYRIRAVGQNDRASRYAGISVKRYTVLALFLSGGLAGLAGIVQVLGLQYRLQTDGSATGFTANAGFNGIVAALFGGLNPLGALPASVFFGGLLVGAQKMQRDIGVSASLITAINGIIVIFVVSSQLFIRRRARYRQNIETEKPAPPPPAEVRQPVYD